MPFQYKSKVSQQNDQQLMHKRNLLYKCQSDEILLNTRVKTLQERLARKIEFNRQAKTSAIVSSLSSNNQDAIECGKSNTAVSPLSDDKKQNHSQMALSASQAVAASVAAAAAATVVGPIRAGDVSSNYSKRLPSAAPTAVTPIIKPGTTILPGQNIQIQSQNVANAESFERIDNTSKQSNFIGSKQFSISGDDSSSSSKDKDSGISLDIHGGKATPDGDDDDETAVTKDMLQDRPSPSGSSGSSDRISTSYPFSSGQKHRAYSTSSANNSSGSTTDSGIDQIDRSSYNYPSRQAQLLMTVLFFDYFLNSSFLPFSSLPPPVSSSQASHSAHLQLSRT